jgi:hypothetical protein
MTSFDATLDRPLPCYRVIHPLDDTPELKCDPDRLGRMALRPVVKWSLLALRSYLIVMILLVGYRVFGSLGVL